VAAIGEADAVLVPALAVAADGTRLGRGGGSYDRALPRVRPDAPIVALLYSAEVRAELPSEPWDVPVTAYVTPDGWYPIGRGNS
jgi:5-formyltetrahydrofolate cyclo-ligase